MRIWILLCLLLLLAACSPKQQTFEEIPLSEIEEGGIIHVNSKDTYATDVALGFDELKLYNITSTNLIENPEKKFSQGGDFGFVVYQLHGLRKDNEGYNWYDVDMLIEDSTNAPVLVYNNMLGNAGRMRLTKNVISVYGNISIPSQAPKGNYEFTVLVHDRIANKEFLKTVPFTVL